MKRMWSCVHAYIAIFLVTIFGVMVLLGAIEIDSLKNIILLVVGFYFGKTNPEQPVTERERQSNHE